MRWTRRRFLVAGAVAAGVTSGAAAWLAWSRRRTARLVRDLLRDAQRRVLAAPVQPKPESWNANGITVCWLGHATVLINFYGLNVLTDPVFSRRIGIGVGVGTLGPKRYIEPALTLRQLPPIDVVLLSHAHMDHTDLPSLRRFPASTFCVTAPVTLELLVDTPLRGATELRWGEQVSYSGPKGELRIRAFQVKHWGRRWPSEKDRGYNGYVLARGGCSLIFGGDTAYTPLFKDLRQHGPYEAAIMPIAAYNPWIRNHCTPEEALEMTRMAGARRIVPIHHRTFRLSDEPMSEPIERLETALDRGGERLALREVGESLTLA